MKNARSFVIVLVTAPDLKTARSLVRGALTRRLIACANLVPKVESHYWWQGRLETGAEVLLVMKTARRRLAALERFILREHPYDTPEFLVLSLDSGTARYLVWVAGSIREAKPC